MTSNRRNPFASSLRNLFDEQWTHIQLQLEAWESNRDKKQEKEAQVSAAIENVVEGTDPRMRIVARYKEKLRVCVRKLMDHIEGLVNDLPGAVDVNQHTFTIDTQVNALFVSKEEMRKHFCHSRDMQTFFLSDETGSCTEAYALLFLIRREKTVLGMSRQEEMLLRDVRQVTVSFTGHRIIAACASEGEARNALEKILFDSVVEYVRIHMARLSDTTHLNKDEMQPTEYSSNLKDPEVYLSELAKILDEPIRLLKLHETILRISKLGIMLDENMMENVNELQLQEVKIGERPTRIVLLVRYPRSEMMTTDELRSEFDTYLH
jgi:hypothetical protein